jgi:CubicO group peptidase (beta-lactamase class C family)
MNDRLLRHSVAPARRELHAGSEFSYNNGGYNLLGGLVKRVSGQPLREFARANIFQPLGMAHSSLRADPARSTPRT